jgi:CheY-like chemotaxis protein
VWLVADSTRLTQVLTNLLNNAASYTPDGGRIVLEAALTADGVAIAVRDSGIGISAEHLPRIFEMFSQARPILERLNAGLGIGLALAKGLVALHGGTISAVSAGEGQGSVFTVTLPLAQGPRRSSPAPLHDHVHSSALKILVVDDNHDAADGLALMLKLMGHAALVAYDGPEALATAEREAPDAILLDIGLPTMNGYEVARHIREQPWGRQVKLVAQTGWGKEQDKLQAAEAGFDHHFIKPLDATQLGRLLTEIA